MPGKSRSRAEKDLNTVAYRCGMYGPEFSCPRSRDYASIEESGREMENCRGGCLFAKSESGTFPSKAKNLGREPQRMRHISISKPGTLYVQSSSKQLARYLIIN